MELKDIITQITNDNNWKSKSRIIGEACEIYVKNNIKCVRCDNNNFEKCKTNEKSKDLICISCNQKYQIKAKNINNKQISNILNKKIFSTLGGDYVTTLNNITENIDYIIILYENLDYNIENILYIKSEYIDNNCIIPRKPLSINAKRVGWQGCYITFNNIEFLL